MYYYSIALLGSPLESLTYHSDQILPIGLQVLVPLSKRELMGVVIAQVNKPDFDTLSIGYCQECNDEAILKDGLPRYTRSDDTIYSDPQIKTAQFMAEYYWGALGEALSLFVPFAVIPCHDTESQIPNRVRNDNTPVIPAKAGIQPKEYINVNITLSPSQIQALDFIRTHPISLLFGDTGSGKSEIYMKRMDEVLSEGKRCLLLLPEISLTPQMEKRFKNHFADAVVLWHSKMAPKQKKNTLEKILDGSAHIIVGARSALFLPIEDLGLIVVDEEHDDSYKSSSRPRYHARDMAVYIGTLLKIPVVLGSATPSLSSYAKYPFFRLRGGYYEAKRSFVYEHSIEALSPFLDEMIEKNADAGAQGIVFLPTRANFKSVVCEGCGYVIECPFCSVGMSLHRHANALKCHYCNYTEVLPHRCPKCQSTHLVTSRLGTAEAVEHFKNRFPTLTIEQFDRDVITTQNKLIKVLEAFNKKEIDLLVGTQMLSKGHDYHDISLAVVMGLDNLLAGSDYRARERALSLLVQIAGRSGRKHDSTVVVQSCNEHFFQSYLEDYELFLRDELTMREGRYPPHKKLVKLLFSHKNGSKAKEQMERAQQMLQGISTVEILGFGAAPIEKIGGKYRFQILLRSDKATHLLRAVKAVKSPLCEVDMDPIEFT